MQAASLTVQLFLFGRLFRWLGFRALIALGLVDKALQAAGENKQIIEVRQNKLSLSDAVAAIEEAKATRIPPPA